LVVIIRKLLSLLFIAAHKDLNRAWFFRLLPEYFFSLFTGLNLTGHNQALNIPWKQHKILCSLSFCPPV